MLAGAERAGTLEAETHRCRQKGAQDPRARGSPLRGLGGCASADLKDVASSPQSEKVHM